MCACVDVCVRVHMCVRESHLDLDPIHDAHGVRVTPLSDVWRGDV
jgi:hypothetical protein